MEALSMEILYRQLRRKYGHIKEQEFLIDYGGTRMGESTDNNYYSANKRLYYNRKLPNKVEQTRCYASCIQYIDKMFERSIEKCENFRQRYKKIYYIIQFIKYIPCIAKIFKLYRK